MPVWQTYLLKILLAAGLGAAVGLERQLSGKVAGIRTNMLICLGAAVLTILSVEMGLRHNDSASRIAAQIVTGVGFLGAGGSSHQSHLQTEHRDSRHQRSRKHVTALHQRTESPWATWKGCP